MKFKFCPICGKELDKLPKYRERGVQLCKNCYLEYSNSHKIHDFSTLQTQNAPDTIYCTAKCTANCARKRPPTTPENPFDFSKICCRYEF